MADKQLIIINDICKLNSPGKKQLQKLMYLMERYGIKMNLNYSIHFYGPYSSKLDYFLHEYESAGLLCINTSGTTHKITMTDTLEACLDENDTEIENYVLDNFSSFTAQELEALTTLDYVSHFMYKDSESKEQIIKLVKIIKGSKFSDDLLNQEYDILEEKKLIKT